MTMQRRSIALHGYWLNRWRAIDIKLFEKELFRNLKKVYESKEIKISKLTECCCRLWRYDILNNEALQKYAYEEAFAALFYEDDYLELRGEAQARDVLEKAFGFYSRTV